MENSVKYYALYDLQIDGFKAGMADTNKEQVIRDGAERAYDLSQGDIEPISDTWSDEKILEMYDYEVREVSKEDYEKIIESNQVGLLTRVNL